jgi:hypothetical protein
MVRIADRLFVFWCLLVAVPISWGGAPKKVDPYDFDFFKHQKLITAYDVVLLKVRAEMTPLGTVVPADTFVLDTLRAPVTKIIRPKTKWDSEKFRSLFRGYDKSKQYESCFCRPTYAVAIRFYGDQAVAVSDPFEPGPTKTENRKVLVATAVLDDGHDSMMVSDMANGLRHFRFSMGHEPTRGVARFMASLAAAEGLDYKFREGLRPREEKGEKTD